MKGKPRHVKVPNLAGRVTIAPRPKIASAQSYKVGAIKRVISETGSGTAGSPKPS